VKNSGRKGAWNHSWLERLFKKKKKNQNGGRSGKRKLEVDRVKKGQNERRNPVEQATNMGG